MDIKRMITEKPFWMAFLLALVSLLLSIPWPENSEPLVTGSTYQIFSDSLSSDIIVFLIPLVSVLPYGEGFIRDYQSGAIKTIIHRSSRNDYRKGKVMAAAVSGCLVWGSACLAMFFILFLRLFPLEIKGGWDVSGVFTMVLKVLRVCMTGNICSVLSGICGVLFLSGYMAYGMPFIIYYLLVILHERYMDRLYCIYPVEWLKLEQFWGKQGWGIWLFLLVIWIFLSVIHAILLELRLKEI